MAVYLTATDAARYRKCSERTQERERKDSTGPAYVRDGRRILYSEAALDEWMAARTFPHRAAEIAAKARPTSKAPVNPAAARIRIPTTKPAGAMG